jgi:hypothetical protein
MYVYVCMYVLYTHVCVYVYTYVRTYVYMYVRMYVYMYVRMYSCRCVGIFLFKCGLLLASLFLYNSNTTSFNLIGIILLLLLPFVFLSV